MLFGLCVSWAHSYMNEIFMLARVRVNVMVDDCNLLFLLSCKKKKKKVFVALLLNNPIIFLLVYQEIFLCHVGFSRQISFFIFWSSG